MYFYTSLSSYIYCPLLRWVNMQEWWVNITGIYRVLQSELREIVTRNKY